MLREAPETRLVLLIDALDELRYHDPEGNLLAWLANLPPLPQNVRFVLTSRPDDDLLRTLRRKQADSLRELSLDLESPQMRDHLQRDLDAYARQLVQPPAVAAALAAVSQAPTDFVAAAVAKAEGNLGYLDALARGIDQALARQDNQALHAVLALRELPDELEGLYAFFLHQIKATVGQQSVEVEDPAVGQVRYLPAWPAVYQRLLGVLAVALAPLTVAQMKALSGVAVDQGYLTDALDRLRQFLDAVDDRYHLYHATVAEFLTAARTAEQRETADLAIDAIRWHRQIATYYWNSFHDDWQRCDEYGLNNLASHLFESGEHERLQGLVSERWMQARYRGSNHTYSGFLSDVDLAWRAELSHERSDIPTLIRLQTARYAVSQRVSLYTDTDLQTLVWLGRESEALAHAQLRDEPRDRSESLLTIHKTRAEKGQARTALVDEAWEAARTIQDPEDRALALTKLATALVLVSDSRAGAAFDEAWQAALATQSERGPGWALEQLVVALAEAGHYDRARAVVRSFEKGRDSRAALDAIATRYGLMVVGGGYGQNWVSAYCKLAAIMAPAGTGAVDQVFDEALDVARSITDGEEQAAALSELATALAAAGDNRATAVLDEARAVVHSIQFDWKRVAALGAVAAALIQVDDRRSSAVLDEARAIAQTGHPDLVYAMMIGRFCQALASVGEHRVAVEIARFIREDENRAEALGRVAETLTEAGFYDDAQEVARAIQVDRERDRALSRLAAALAQIGQCHTAEKVAGPIQDTEERAFATGAIAICQARAGQYQEALEMARTIRSDQMRAWALSEVAVILARAGESQASAVLDEAVRRQPNIRIDTDWPRMKVLIDLAATLAQAGSGRARFLFDEAREMARAMANQEERERTLQGLAAALAKSGYYDEAETVARSIEGERTRDDALYDVIAALAQGGHYDEAWDAAGSIQDDLKGEEALGAIAVALARAQHDDMALKMADLIQNDEVWEQTLSGIAIALAEVGYYDEAMEYASAIQDYSPRAAALSALAASLAEAEQYEEAWWVAQYLETHPISDDELAEEELDSEAQEAAQAFARHTLGGDTWLVHVYSVLGKALAEAGESEAAVVFDVALDVAHSINRRDEQVLSLIELGQSLDLAGDHRASEVFDQALETIGRLTNIWRVPRLQELTTALVQTGHEDPAREVVQSTRNEAERRDVLHALATALARVGRLSDALTALGPRTLDEFLQTLTEWAPAFEQLQPGLAVPVLREAIGVAGWVRPDWRRIDELLATRQNGAAEAQS